MRDRSLVCIACAWLGGVLVENGITGAPTAWAIATGALLVVSLWLAVRHARGALAATCLAAIAAGATASSLQRARVEAARDWAWTGIAVTFEGVVARIVHESAVTRRVVVDVDGVLDGDVLHGECARVLAVERGEPLAWSPLLPGDRVRFRGVARAPRGFAGEGAFDRARWLGGKGIDRIVSTHAPGLAVVDAPATPSLWRIAARIRRAASRVVDASGDPRGRALVAALVVGDRAAVPPEVEDSFRRAGVSHVLSVSGLHLAIVALLLFRGARRAWLWFPRLAMRVPADRAAAFVAAPIAILYTLGTGAEVATVRALAATLVALAAAALGRRFDAWTALAFAALAITVDAPWSLFDPSFQLSFVAAASLVVVGRMTAGWGRALPWTGRALVFVGRLALASLAATLATAPLTALHFGVVQPAGVITNLVVVPVAELIVVPLGLLGAIVGCAVPAVGETLCAIAAEIAAWLARFVEWAGARAPVLELAPPRPVELLAWFTALAAVAWARPLRRAALAVAGSAAVLAGSIAWHAWTGAPANDVTVTFLDVGQGDAAVIEAGDETWLIDAGGRLFDGGGADPGEQAVWPFLRARRVRRVDLAIVSHPHPDHYGGLAAVASHVPIDEIWVNGDDPGDPRWERLLDDLRARGTRVVSPSPGVARRLRQAQLRVLAPHEIGGSGARVAADPAVEINDNSLVVRLEVGPRSILFPGDLEAPGERALIERFRSAPSLLDADVVKAPHHGSRTSSSSELVRATTPELVVVSCGVDNPWGFPAPDVVDRWRNAGARVLRTDLHGAVTLRLTAGGAIGVDTTLDGRGARRR